MQTCPLCQAPHPENASCVLEAGHPFYAWGYTACARFEYALVVPCAAKWEAEAVKEFFWVEYELLCAGSADTLPSYPRAFRLFSGTRPLIYRWFPHLLSDALAYTLMGNR